ncbi:MAG TPA: phosphoribosylanthranilate isomerase [Vicinamibacterales bacterium]|nr:phosphoribosylanthranilate isomerase [Vicinamibacterales bacterium]
MTRVKICGVTRPEDARAAADAGASAVGMVFWPGSPRAVDTAAARAIVAALPAGVPAIGVFVNQTADEINAAIDAAGLFGVQLHGDEPVELIERIRRPVIRAVTLGGLDVIDVLPPQVTVLLDAVDHERRGGTGRTIDWTAAAAVARRRPIVLAGGLASSNVEQAIAEVRPYAVDVSSGVETAPGLKDHARIAAFISAVRRADAGDTLWA